jgi:Zn-dependent M28 family amino/carboxypeptidase
VGSFYYVKHPLLPMDKTVAMVNLDMVGCIEGDAVMASGSATSKLLTKMIGRAAHEHGLNLIELPGNIGGSDHIPFYTHEVPVVHWMTTGGRLHYHRPSDDLETLDCGGIARIAAMAADLVVELAESQERPEYKDSGWGGTIIRNVIRLVGSAASAMAEPR